ncbi:MAG: hypothetical protein GY927_19310 [bacterium]|nr:hypothetical protein [bacterium]
MRELTGVDELMLADGAKVNPIASMISLLSRLSSDHESDASLAAIEALTLDEWERKLLYFRQQALGDVITAECQCNKCGEGVSLVFRISDLPVDTTIESLQPVVLNNNESVTLRPLRIGDLKKLEAENPPDKTSRLALLMELATGKPEGWGTEMLRGENNQQLINALDAAAKDLDLQLGTNCTACDADIQTHFDVTDFVTVELLRNAEQMLDHVHTIAQSYHWSEAEILTLGISRRTAYLLRIDASTAIKGVSRSIGKET